MKLSVCSVVKNEEFFLPMMIESALQFADEIIIVIDETTDDKTVEEINKFKNDKIKYFMSDYGTHFGQGRQEALNKASGDWIFFLDADELIHEKDAEKIKPLIDIEVDGNVSFENIPKMVKAGANVLVAGTSSIFKKDIPLSEAYQQLMNLLDSLSK